MSRVCGLEPYHDFLLIVTLWHLHHHDLCHTDPVDTCQKPAAVGPCDAVVPMWYFNSQTHTCEKFNWGGCGGNDNKFATKDECEKRCGGHSVQCCAKPKPSEEECGLSGCHCCSDGEWLLGNSGPTLTPQVACGNANLKPSKPCGVPVRLWAAHCFEGHALVWCVTARRDMFCFPRCGVVSCFRHDGL